MPAIRTSLKTVVCPPGQDPKTFVITDVAYDGDGRMINSRFLDGLPIELRAVFVLAEIDELPASQIAPLLDLPPGTVASRLRRAREMFDARLARMHAKRRFVGGAS